MILTLSIIIGFLFIICIYQQYILYKIGKKLKITDSLIEVNKNLIIDALKYNKNNVDSISNLQNYIKMLEKKTNEKIDRINAKMLNNTKNYM